MAKEVVVGSDRLFILLNWLFFIFSIYLSGTIDGNMKFLVLFNGWLVFVVSILYLIRVSYIADSNYKYAISIQNNSWVVSKSFVDSENNDWVCVFFRHQLIYSESFYLGVHPSHPDIKKFQTLYLDDVVEFSALHQSILDGDRNALCGYIRIVSVKY